MLDERLQALVRGLEHLAPEDQQQLADRIEEWLDDLEWRRVLNEPGPDALYDAAMEEMRRGETLPLRLEDFDPHGRRAEIASGEVAVSVARSTGVSSK